MNPIMKSPFKLSPRTVIDGKWNHEQYEVVKELGFGANGTVFLTTNSNGSSVAVKLSTQTSSVASEVNVLKALSKVQGSSLGPSLYDVDDWSINGKTIPFYAMEYIEGKDIKGFIQERGTSWILVLTIQLLNDLHQLHELGWVFGDLKPENLIVSTRPPRIRCVDVGGTTQIGRSIKEFTEFYDRGYWGLGSRKAEPSYDLFAVAMVIISLYYGDRFAKKGESIGLLKKKIQGIKELGPYETVLLKSIKGEFQSALEMRSALLNCKAKYQPVHSNPKQSPSSAKNANTMARPIPQRSRYKKRKASKSASFIETILLVAIVTMFYTLYIVGEVLNGSQ
ncbi:serine/threonine protein kinase PrkT [Bacillus carboniphilus]|uniref:Serine/threonine protein kinase PrkT n=1 Tax=Bacillus carboniphilus TaxID=86663 RepID=A0ABP3FMZ5_9BACI